VLGAEFPSVNEMDYVENPFLRAEIWKILLGYSSLNSEIREKTVRKKREDYKESIEAVNRLFEDPMKNMSASEYKSYKQIIVDIPRTMPGTKLFSEIKMKLIMTRILFLWAIRHPHIGYVQGFNDMCTPFIIVFLSQYIDLDQNNLNTFDESNFASIGQEELLEIEADSFGCFSSMMSKIQNNYLSNQPTLMKMVEKLEEIVRKVDSEVAEHFEKTEIKFIQFAFRWMNCFLMREFRLKLIIRLWDTYFSEEDAFNNFHLFVCAGLLLSFSERIKKADFQELILFLQDLPTEKWDIDDIDVLLAKTFQIISLYGKVVK
jgi:hypothetical protein